MASPSRTSDIPAEDLVLHSIPARSDTTIVVFSGLKVRPGRFHFFNLAQQFSGVSILLVRDPASNWYNTGLPGVGDSIDEIAKTLADRVEEMESNRILTVGSSMGGYAAILFGCLLGAERAVALSPQTLLDVRLPLLVPTPDVPLETPDLRPVMWASPETQVSLAVSWENLLDVFHAQRVADLPSAEVLGVPASKHILAVELNREGRLWPFIAAMLEGRIPPGAEPKPVFPADAVDDLHGSFLALGRDDWRAFVDKIGLVSQRMPDWQAARLAHEKALKRLSSVA